MDPYSASGIQHTMPQLKRRKEEVAVEVEVEVDPEDVHNAAAASFSMSFNATAMMERIGQDHLPGLPSSLNCYFATIETADPTPYLVVAAAIVIGLVLVILRQIKARFSRPPPVPTKRLPMRPALSIQFKPNNIASTGLTSNNIDAQTVGSVVTATATATAYPESSSIRKATKSGPFPRNTSSILRSSFETESTTMNARDPIMEAVGIIETVVEAAAAPTALLGTRLSEYYFSRVWSAYLSRAKPRKIF